MKPANLRIGACAVAASALGMLATCAAAQTPMSYAQTFGPAGDPVTRLGWGLGGISLAVVVIVGVLVLAGTMRRRRDARSVSYDRLAASRDEGGMAWIYVGVGLSTIVLIACAAWTLDVLAKVNAPPGAPALTVEVGGQQWWWDVRYRSDDPSQTFITANEIHIPVGKPVRFVLTSPDVIHSFWVPQLAGKTDVIPGQRNVAWLQADKPGTYRGQCAEYCGAQHAHMALVVVADPPAQFDAWKRAQIAAATAPADANAEHGMGVFVARCGACHTVRGTGAGGLVGPDLTHLMSRHTLAAGLLPNDRGNLAAWIEGAQGLKPGTRMPSIRLPGDELAPLLAYLATLR